MKIPDFLIVGAAKSGTSSLHSYLSTHPEVCMPRVIKELNFWHTYRHEKERAILKYSNNYPKSPEEYIRHFNHGKPYQLFGEASPSYLIYYKDTIDNLKHLHLNWQNVKIIIILREPIDKIWSHYKFICNKKLDPDNLLLPELLKKENIRINDSSLLPDLHLVHNTKYYAQVKYYKDHFNHVKILLFDELLENSQKVFDEITDFLGIQRLSPENLRKKFNTGKNIKRLPLVFDKIRTNPIKRIIPSAIKRRVFEFISKEEIMSDQTRFYLSKIFKSEIEKLDTIVEKDLSQWLKNYE